jgi:pimeloyl-ACP methyl ester carboxylesterase/DNA-binding CsgD family transcriptional regulator
VAAAVVRTGSGRAAAAATGLFYSTVRGALSSGARRMGAPNLASLVRALVAAAYGVLPGEGDPGTILADMLPLTSKQGRVAALVAEGLSRPEIAAATGRGAATVKKELEQIYAVLGVASAAELARMVVEVRALRLFARSTDGTAGFLDSSAEPTRFAPRGDGTSIAWSDYGPSSARPVLIVPSNWQARPVPRPLIAALHAAGFRPIAIDRPGIGGTPPPRDWTSDPFSQAILDTQIILDGLGLAKVAVIARGGAQFMAALKNGLPDRVGSVVLVSPTPQTSDGGKRQGIMGVVKEAFYRNPATIGFFFRTVSAQMNLKRVEALHRSIVAGSPTDEALMDDPQFVRDRFRAIRPLATGNTEGALREQRVISQGGYAYRSVDARNWAVLQGLQDVYNSLEEVEAYWRPLLPGARFEAVPDGGRFTTSSHADLIVRTLDALGG